MKSIWSQSEANMKSEKSIWTYFNLSEIWSFYNFQTTSLKRYEALDILLSHISRLDTMSHKTIDCVCLRRTKKYTYNVKKYIEILVRIFGNFHKKNYSSNIHSDSLWSHSEPIWTNMKSEVFTSFRLKLWN